VWRERRERVRERVRERERERERETSSFSGDPSYLANRIFSITYPNPVNER
jgi:hypothetical protein